MKKFILALATCTLIAVSACGAPDNSTQKTAGKPVATAKAPKQAAVIELKSMDQMPTNGLMTIIDFNATWCGPCRMFAPTFAKAAAKFDGKANFVSVDIDKFPEFATKYGVRSIPFVAFVKPDGTYRYIMGAMGEDEFLQLVSEQLK